MNFLVDAQLPRRLAYRLRDFGHDAVHTLDLPLKNRTPDSDVKEISLREKRIVVTKDGELVDSFFLQGKPYKLLLVSTGNIKNADLEKLFLQNIEHIAESFEQHNFIEIDKTMVTIHA
jgi:predicted nuclease of predicted toxin-antitoxin system